MAEINSFENETVSDEDAHSIMSLDPQELKLASDQDSTKRLSKSARNRFYAQTSRARHRQYVENLENDRNLLLERLERIEEDNKRMREELDAIKMNNENIFMEAASNISNYSAKKSRYITNQSNVLDVLFPFPFLLNENSQSNSLNTSINTNYALSVLDLIIPHLDAFLKKKSKPFKMTNSPRLSNDLNLNPLVSHNIGIELILILFLVIVILDGCEGKMSWSGDNFWDRARLKMIMIKRFKKNKIYHSRIHEKMREMSTLEKLMALKKLEQLKTYLQQFGNNK